MTDRRPVLVGLEPGAKGALSALSPAGQSGGRLARLCGLDRDTYVRAFELVNLHEQPGQPKKRDRDAALRIAWEFRGRRLVVLGSRNREAFELGDEWWTWRVHRGVTAAAAPHPSGKSRFWNDPIRTVAAEAFFRSVRKPCVHVEGPDGAGKSVLARRLADALGCGLVPTQGPQTTWEECERRINLRAVPGFVSDRSSGLVSELVYGPVLRGHTCSHESMFWSQLWAIRHAVTFVYCRPERVLPTFREEEDQEFRDSILNNAAKIDERYQAVMAEMERIGCRVLRYDWLTDQNRIEEIAKACAE